MRNASRGLCAVSLVLMLIWGCEQPQPSDPGISAPAVSSTGLMKSVPAASESPAPAASKRMLGDLNLALTARGVKYRVMVMEYVTAPTSGQFGSTVFAKDVGNKQLAFHFAAPLVTSPNAITYVVDTHDGAASGGLTNADTEPAIDRAMATWDNVAGSGLLISRMTLPGVDLGIVQALLGFGGAPVSVADVTHAGWLPKEFFDALAPDGGDYILGATFTFIWVDVNGDPVDTNGDRKFDVAFREIYYNNGFAWTNDPVTFVSPLVDVESIALHEAGHGLSQAHFGMVFFDGKGTAEPGFQVEHLHFAPRAVMNAIYWETQRELLGSDVAGHLSIWATWPK